MKNRNPIKLIRVLSLVVLLSMLLTAFPMAVESEEKEISGSDFLALLDYDAAVEDVKYLSQTIGARPAGSKSEQLALDYFSAECKELGYKIQRQTFNLNRSVGDVQLGDLTLAAQTPTNNSYYTGFGEAEGTAVYLDDPANVASLGEDLSGKVVFFPGNWNYGKDPDTYSAIAALDAANAEGIVIMMDLSIDSAERTRKYLPTLNFSSPKMTISTPVLLTNSMEAERVPAYLAEHENVKVKLNSTTTCQPGNAIAIKKAATRTDRTLYISAHIDSVIPSPGANDNGSGVAGVLAMARAFAQIETNYNIAFIAFGAEETGLNGSSYYVSTLGSYEIDNAIGNYNIDMIATSQADCNHIVMLAPSSTKDNRVIRASYRCAEDLGYDMDYYTAIYNTQSDHASFHKAGIPAVEYIWCRTGNSLTVENYYHSSCDNMDENFSRERLKKQLDVVALAAYRDATADFVAVVGTGVDREYYTSMEEAVAAAGENGILEELPSLEEDPNNPDITYRLDYDKAVDDVSYLSKTIGTRPAGSMSEQLALNYVAQECEALGYEIETQTFPTNYAVGDIYLGDLVLAAGTPSNNSYYTGFGEAEGTAVYLDDPANVASLGDDLTGKVVFFPGNWRSGKDPDTYTAIAALDAANAEGIVVMMDLSIYEGERLSKSFPTLNFSSQKMNISTPVLLVNSMEAERVPAYLAEYENVPVKLNSRTKGTSQNVIATKKAAVETDRTIYVSAHIDSVLPSPGANDNGSGVAGVLTLARAFKDIDTKYNITFCFFGAEEIYLVGSLYYTKTLTAEQIDNAIGNYNLDMIATAQEDCQYIYMDSCINASLNSSALDVHVSRMARKAAKKLGYDMDMYLIEYNTASDHQAFHRVGIPAIEFIWCNSTTAPDVEAYYHTSCDTMEMNFDVGRLQSQVDVIAQAICDDALADYVAVVGEGIRREYYTSMEEAIAAAGETGKPVQLRDIESEELALSHTLNLASDISVNFAVLKTALEGYDMDSVYVESTLQGYDAEGQPTETTLKLYPEEKEYHYYFTLEGLTAVEMSDSITSTLCGVKDGISYVSPVDDYSVAEYAYSQMNKAEASAELKTLCADLLRYGSKAQSFKDYGTDKLADGQMTEEQRVYLSDMEAVAFGSTNSVLTDVESPSVRWLGKSLDLASKVTIKYIFDPTKCDAQPEDMDLHLSYMSIDGELEEAVIEGAEIYDVPTGVCAFSFDGLLAAELRSVVSAQIFVGDSPVSCTLEYSADTYGNNKTGVLGELCKALFAYSDSAKVYFLSLS